MSRTRRSAARADGGHARRQPGRSRRRRLERALRHAHLRALDFVPLLLELAPQRRPLSLLLLARLIGLDKPELAVATLLEHMSDDVDWGIEAQSSSEVPWHGVGVGKKFARAFFERYPDRYSFELIERS